MLRCRIRKITKAIISDPPPYDAKCIVIQVVLSGVAELYHHSIWMQGCWAQNLVVAFPIIAIINGQSRSIHRFGLSLLLSMSVVVRHNVLQFLSCSYSLHCYSSL